MNEYVIFTDSGCDISPELLAEWGVKHCCLTFRFTDEDREYGDNDISIDEFYKFMRDGRCAKTAAVNSETFKAAFKEELDKGNDVLYIGISSGISTTYNSGRMAAEELSEEYPDRKIIAFDSLAASAGLGLTTYIAVKNKEKGMSIEENAKYIENIKLNVCHWVAVDDLQYLKRGGRISPTLAFIGGALGLKPIIHVDNEGKLVNVAKARGRKLSLKILADKYTELVKESDDKEVFISHADCADEAKVIADMIEANTGKKVDLITNIGTVIGAHAGPGTIALFFVGKER